MKPFAPSFSGLVIATVVALTLRAGAETPAPVPEPASPRTTEGAGPTAATTATEPRTLRHDGLTFVLARSTRHDSTETEEYFLQGESQESWSQMITYQRVTLPEPLGTDAYISWMKKRFEQNPGGPRLKVVQQGKTASIFGVQYPKTEKTDPQFGLALAMVADPRRPNELHIIQYVINPARVSLADMELQVKRWQTRFQSQAASLAR